jgi:hypothetical protein
VVVRQGLSGLLIGLQRVGLPAGPVEGHHQVQPKMIKPGRVGQDPRIGGEPVQRRATPQTECRAQRSRSRLAVSPSQRRPSLQREPFELPYVHGVGRNL